MPSTTTNYSTPPAPLPETWAEPRAVSVWIAELNEQGEWPWIHDCSYRHCWNEPALYWAKQGAHARARYLRCTFHCAFVAVRLGEGPPPLPVNVLWNGLR